MALNMLGKLAAMAGLVLMLAGCVDIELDVALTSPETGRISLTQTMGADFYAMLKMDAPPKDGKFCPQGEFSETDDGGAVCTITQQGRFAQLDLGEYETPVHFRSAGLGLVRISVPTAPIRAELDMGEDMDQQTRQMLDGILAKRAVTLRFSGLAIAETNMELTPDGAAEIVIPFSDLLDPKVRLPVEYYAVVRAP